jgi:hypothetical protein
MFAVLVFCSFQAFIYSLLINAVFGQCSSDEAVHAVTHKITIILDRMGRETKPGQDCIHRVRNVGECVEQCAVKVKYDCLKFYLYVSKLVAVCFLLLVRL